MTRCRFRGEPECAFCRQGETYGMGPCHDRRTRELLDERGIWWPGSKMTWEPEDYRAWKRRQRLNGEWSRVYHPAIHKAMEEIRKWQNHMQHGKKCELCGATIQKRYKRCKHCMGADLRWNRYAQKRA